CSSVLMYATSVAGRWGSMCSAAGGRWMKSACTSGNSQPSRLAACSGGGAGSGGSASSVGRSDGSEFPQRGQNFAIAGNCTIGDRQREQQKASIETSSSDTSLSAGSRLQVSAFGALSIAIGGAGTAAGTAGSAFGFTSFVSTQSSSSFTSAHSNNAR